MLLRCIGWSARLLLLGMDCLLLSMDWMGAFGSSVETYDRLLIAYGGVIDRVNIYLIFWNSLVLEMFLKFIGRRVCLALAVTACLALSVDCLGAIDAGTHIRVVVYE